MATTTASAPPPMQGTKQQDKLLRECKERIKERYLNSFYKDGILIIDYRTTGGYFVRSYYDKPGTFLGADYFNGYNEIDLEPVSYICSKPSK